MKNKTFAAVILITGTLAFWQDAAQAQMDPHFSQYYIHPMILNPALTGAFEGDYRVSSVWRSQFSNTLVTEGLSAEAVTNKNMNFGLNLMNEQTEDKSYNYTNGYVSMAYTGVRFGPRADHFLVLAAQFGFINRRFDVNKLQFGSQWLSSTGFDPSMTSGENFVKPSVTTFDAGVGIAYYDATPNKKVSFFGGASAFHITKPENPLLSGDISERLPVRYCFHAGVRIIESDIFSIVPTALYMKEGNMEEKMIGAYLQIYASDDADVMLGANWRFNDAAAPFVGLYYKGLTFGLSYDVNVAQGQNIVSNNGSFEASISYSFQKTGIKTSKFYCPRF